MWNLRNKTKRKGEKSSKPRNKLNYRELMVNRGEAGLGGCVKQGMGIKEYTYDEHQVLYASIESLYQTPETNVKLLTN